MIDVHPYIATIVVDELATYLLFVFVWEEFHQ